MHSLQSEAVMRHSNRQVEELNSLTTASIIYQLPTGEEVLNGNTIRDWLSIDENGHYYKDEAVMQQKIAEYVADMASRVDTAGKDRPFTTTSGLEITVGGEITAGRLISLRKLPS